MLILSVKEKAGATKERTSDYCMCKEKLGIADCIERQYCVPEETREGLFYVQPPARVWVGLSVCPAKCLSCHELGTPRFQLPVPLLLDSQVRLFPVLPSFSGQSILQSGCWFPHGCVPARFLSTGTLQHRVTHVLFSSFPSLLPAARRLLKMWWEW